LYPRLQGSSVQQDGNDKEPVAAAVTVDVAGVVAAAGAEAGVVDVVAVVAAAVAVEASAE